MSDRRYDLTLFGATGFTGQLVAEYLATAAPANVKLALAGRNRARLEAVRAKLPAGRDIALLEADSSNPASLDEVAKHSRVICTTVGPYAKYGLPLVEACARNGTHSTDLTGEVQFMRDSIDRYDAMAKASGARIVHSCGFDSIPSDLGVLLLHEAEKAAGRSGTFRRMTYVLEVGKGGFSGGTVASLINALEEGRLDKSRRKMMADPYALSPDRAKEPDLGRERDLMTFEYDDFVGRWVAPFVMAAINTRAVRRSNALLGYAYGRNFRYREVTGMPKGPRGFLLAASFSYGLGALMASLMIPATRTLVMKALPAPGEGPDEHTRKTGLMRVRFTGESEDGRRVSAKVFGRGDPGYQLTSVMLGEASLALLDESKLPARTGVLTPATALGMTLIERLRAAGMEWTVEA